LTGLEAPGTVSQGLRVLPSPHLLFPGSMEPLPSLEFVPAHVMVIGMSDAFVKHAKVWRIPAVNGAALSLDDASADSASMA
jgi:predicted YcjX-like family ATPase